jgi:hypothetical protein
LIGVLKATDQHPKITITITIMLFVVNHPGTPNVLSTFDFPPMEIEKVTSLSLFCEQENEFVNGEVTVEWTTSCGKTNEFSTAIVKRERREHIIMEADLRMFCKLEKLTLSGNILNYVHIPKSLHLQTVVIHATDEMTVNFKDFAEQRTVIFNQLRNNPHDDNEEEYICYRLRCLRLYGKSINIVNFFPARLLTCTRAVDIETLVVNVEVRLRWLYYDITEFHQFHEYKEYKKRQTAEMKNMKALYNCFTQEYLDDLDKLDENEVQKDTQLLSWHDKKIYVHETIKIGKIPCQELEEFRKVFFCGFHFTKMTLFDDKSQPHCIRNLFNDLLNCDGEQSTVTAFVRNTGTDKDVHGCYYSLPYLQTIVFSINKSLELWLHNREGIFESQSRKHNVFRPRNASAYFPNLNSIMVCGRNYCTSIHQRRFHWHEQPVVVRVPKMVMMSSEMINVDGGDDDSYCVIKKSRFVKVWDETNDGIVDGSYIRKSEALEDSKEAIWQKIIRAFDDQRIAINIDTATTTQSVSRLSWKWRWDPNCEIICPPHEERNMYIFKRKQQPEELRKRKPHRAPYANIISYVNNSDDDDDDDDVKRQKC